MKKISLAVMVLLFFVINLTAATFFADSSTPVNWSTVNSALSSENVTIYFGATSTYGNLDLINKIDSSKTLTLDGNSYYKSGTTWLPYTGTSKCVLNTINSQDCNHKKHSNIVIRGVKCVQTISGKILTIAGDNWLVENSEFTTGNGAGDGPGVLIVPTCDGPHEGSSCWTPPCNNIVFRNNIIHDSVGEALYIGGGGVMDGSSGAGYPSHSNITITDNEIYAAGSRGAQGDGIDGKGGIINLTISNNKIHDLVTASARGIVIQGQQNGVNGNLKIIGNYLSNITAEDGAIAVVNSWGSPKGVLIANNVVINTKTGNGLRIYSCQDVPMIINNTIVGSPQYGISADSSINVRNNLLLNHTSGPARYTAQISDYNGYSGPKYAGEGGNSFLTTSSANFVNANNDFHLIVSAPAIGKGVNLSSLITTDIDGKIRPSNGAWDVGAYQYAGSLPVPPKPPSNLIILSQ